MSKPSGSDGQIVGSYLPAELAAWLRHEAQANGRTLSGQVRLLLGRLHRKAQRDSKRRERVF